MAKTAAIEAVFGPLERIEDGRRRSLHRKIRASLRRAESLRLDTDIDAQLRAEAFAGHVGPRPLADAKVLAILREALLAGMLVKFRYGEVQDSILRRRKVIPYGLLFAPDYYLVASTKSKPEPVLFRLDRIRDLEVTDEPGAPPGSFDLDAYASPFRDLSRRAGGHVLHSPFPPNTERKHFDNNAPPFAHRGAARFSRERRAREMKRVIADFEE